jgi:Rrf2 family protein
MFVLSFMEPFSKLWHIDCSICHHRCLQCGRGLNWVALGGNWMKVRKSSAYALHALMYMVRHRNQLPATISAIAKAQGIPSSYLAKVFQQLVKARFVRAGGEKRRGFVFAGPAEEIDLLERFGYIEGEFNDLCRAREFGNEKSLLCLEETFSLCQFAGVYNYGFEMRLH